MLDMVADGAPKIRPLITHEFRPEQAEEAYRFVDEKPSEYLGVYFGWGNEPRAFGLSLKGEVGQDG